MLLTIASAFFYTEIKSGTFMKILSEVMKVLWIKWELPGMVVLSLFLQFLLLMLGNRQKFRGHKSPYVAIVVWLTYLAADWVATVALSTLLRAEEKELNSELVVFWTPFLLLHLGGPHTISAYSLSDNELWLRYLLGLIIQVGVAVYVYMRFRTNSTLTYMAILVFIAGIVKYGERIWILRAASRRQFSNSIFLASKPSSLTHPVGAPASPDHSMEVSPTDDRPANQTLDDYLKSKKVIQEGKNIHRAFCLYKMFIPLFLDLKLRIDEDLTHIITLSSLSVEDAFNLVEMELGFLYDVLYTKTTILQSIAGVILRCICLLSTFSALIAFSIIFGKSDYPKLDTAITYMLLSGAILLDVFPAILHVFSNWTMLVLTIPDNKVHKFIGSRRISWLMRDRGKKEITSMAQYNVIHYGLKTSWWTKIVKFIDTEDNLAKFWCTWEPVNLDLKKFIHSSLQKKLEKYVASKFKHQELVDLLADKGKSVLRSKELLDEKFIKWSIEDVEFSHSLLLWHIATFLLFQDDHKRYSGSVLGSYCQISKLLSDYMMYLLLVKPLMLPKGIGEVRIRETREEVRRFFNKQSSLTESDAANALLHINLELAAEMPVQSKSVLLDGCKLASKLQASMEEMLLDHEEKWKMIADVWVEMLAFAASKCEWRQHAMQLKNGEELLTHVALLMAHFGLTEHIRIVEVEESSESHHVARWDWGQLSQLAYYLA